jgi:hypothetical protein
LPRVDPALLDKHPVYIVGDGLNTRAAHPRTSGVPFRPFDAPAACTHAPAAAPHSRPGDPVSSDEMRRRTPSRPGGTTWPRTRGSRARRAPRRRRGAPPPSPRRSPEPAPSYRGATQIEGPLSRTEALVDRHFPIDPVLPDTAGAGPERDRRTRPTDQRPSATQRKPVCEKLAAGADRLRAHSR